MDKRTFKVMAPITKQDGGHFWMRCGTGYLNRDNSINIYLDVLPKDWRFTLRELDEEDLRRREAYRANGGGHDGGMLAAGRMPAMPAMPVMPAAPADDEAALSL